jgi:hypothetical protein
LATTTQSTPARSRAASVLQQPQLAEAVGLRLARVIRQNLGRELGPHDDAEILPGHYDEAALTDAHRLPRS